MWIISKEVHLSVVGCFWRLWLHQWLFWDSEAAKKHRVQYEITDLWLRSQGGVISFFCVILTCRNIFRGAGTWRSGPSFPLGPLPSCLALRRPRLWRRLPSRWRPALACWCRSWSAASLYETKESWDRDTHTQTANVCFCLMKWLLNAACILQSDLVFLNQFLQALFLPQLRHREKNFKAAAGGGPQCNCVWSVLLERAGNRFHCFLTVSLPPITNTLRLWLQLSQ